MGTELHSLTAINTFLQLIFLGFVAAASAQQYECDCSIQPEIVYLPPLITGPIYEFPSTGLSGECGERDTITCQWTCLETSRTFFRNNALTDPKQGDEQVRTWGQFFCDESRRLGGVTFDPIAAQIETLFRILVWVLSKRIPRKEKSHYSSKYLTQ